jgi:hypothetical protein
MSSSPLAASCATAGTSPSAFHATVSIQSFTFDPVPEGATLVP